MKKSYYLFLLLLVAATSFSVHAQTGQKWGSRNLMGIFVEIL